ncbi:MAG: TPM domain-containing protein [Oscillospiraceae bacterium]|jgi:uncharacterized membrane protein YgcG
MKKYGTAAVFLVVCLLLIGAAPILPTVDFYVNDAANILIDRHKDTMMAASSGLEQQSGTQLVLLTLPSLEEQGYDDLETFAHDVFTSWEIGGRKEENGLLIVAVKSPAACTVRVGKAFAGAITPAQINEVCQTVVATMQKGNATKALMDLYSALSLRVYEILELEPPNGEITRQAAASNRLPYLLLAGVFLVVARSYRVSRKYRSRYGGFSHKRRRQFSRQQRDEDAMESSRVPELYDRIGREKTADSSWEPAEQQEGAEQ